jgi:tetratricopeptide (TPR) repeat protein
VKAVLVVCLVVLAGGCLPRESSRLGAFGRRPAPAGAYAEYIRGRAASDSGDHAAAIRHFQAASRLAPDDASLRVAIGEEHLAAGDLDAAGAELARIFDRWPDDVDAWILAGRLGTRRERHAEAARAFEKAFALDPEHIRAYLLAASSHLRRGDKPAARRVYEQLLARFPRHPDAHLRLARLDVDAGDWAAAEVHLTAVLAAAPDDIDARVLLARAYQRRGRASDATSLLREAYDRSGEDPWVGEQLFRAFLAGGERDAAIALLADLDGAHRTPAARIAFAQLYLVVRQPADALRICQEVLVAHPDRHDARLIASRAHAQVGQRDAAIAAALAVPAGAEEWPAAQALAAEQTHRSGKRSEALALVEAALAHSPDSPVLLGQTALLLWRAGREAAGRKLLEEARLRRPQDDELVFVLAFFEERAGRAREAVELIRREVLAEDPDHVGALNLVGYTLAEHGLELDAAESALRRAMDLSPDDGYILDSWGVLLLRRGKLDEAGEALEQADRLAPGEAEILLHRGELEVARGRRGEAEKWFERALALDPDDELADRIKKHRTGAR